MNNIFNDPTFEKYLYGGIHDLDEPIGQLIYNLWKSGIQTTRSCSGHIGNFLKDGGENALGGYLAYQPGILCYNPKNAERLTTKLEETRQKYSFATLKHEEESIFYLEMKDISTNFRNFEKGIAKVQVAEHVAKPRYRQFLQIWEELTLWSEQLKK